MAADLFDCRENSLQRFYEATQCCRLSQCACVFRFLIAVEATDITYSDGVFVMPIAVCALHVNRSALMDAAVKIDEIVIADVLPSIMIHMIVADGFNGCFFIWNGSSAMDDDFIYCSHNAI